MAEDNKKQINSKSQVPESNKANLMIIKHQANFNNQFFAKINERIKLFILTKKIIKENKSDK